MWASGQGRSLTQGSALKPSVSGGIDGHHQAIQEKKQFQNQGIQ
jgi:hypothetical protein